MNKETQALESNSTWELTTLPAGKSPIGNKWVFRIKLRVDGFQKCYADTSLFTLTKGTSFIALLIYVDDILLTGSDKTMIQSIKHQLIKQSSIKDLGSLHYYLGIAILHNSKGLFTSQIKYALDLLQCADVLNHKPSTLLLDPLKNLNLTDGAILPNPSLYRKLVGKLIYLTVTRLDLSFAAQALSQFSHQPTTSHMDALYIVLSDWTACPITR
ncbi:uncharacterized mitochondrial protein-like protein, partial [Tanacetum coccineum]